MFKRIDPGQAATQINTAGRVQPVLLPNAEPCERVERLGATLRSAFGRAPLIVMKPSRRRGAGPSLDATVAEADTGPLARALIAAHHCRSMRPAPVLLLIAGATDPATIPVATWQTLAVAAGRTKRLVVGTERVGWSTRGPVFIPGSRVGGCGTRPIAQRDWIGEPAELDRHLELGVTVAPTPIAAVPTWHLLDRAMRHDPELTKGCAAVARGASKGARRIVADGAPKDERPLAALVNIVGADTVDLLPIERTAPKAPAREAAVRLTRAQTAEAVFQTSRTPRQSLGMIWRMPSEQTSTVGRDAPVRVDQ